MPHPQCRPQPCFPGALTQCTSKLKSSFQEHFSQLLSWVSFLMMHFSRHGLWLFYHDSSLIPNSRHERCLYQAPLVLSLLPLMWHSALSALDCSSGRIQTLQVRDHILIFVLPSEAHAASGTRRHYEGKGFCSMTQCTWRMRERRAAQIMWRLSRADDWHDGSAINSTRRLMSSVSDLLSVS